MPDLQFDALLADKRIADAFKSIGDTVADYQRTLELRGPNSQCVTSYDDLLNTHSQNRGGALWYPYIGSGLGSGALVELADGSVKYDFISGIGAHFGHGLPQLVQASLHAALESTIQQGNLQQSRVSTELYRVLTESSGLPHCVVSTSGATGGENALKLAFHHRSPAHRVLAFEGCFAGRTLALAQLTDKPQYRQGLPDTIEVDYIPFYDASDPDGSTQRAVDRLTRYLKRYPGQYAVMSMELVQGENGFYPGTHEFFMALISVLNAHEVLVWVDECQTFGRTDHLYAYHHFGLADHVDIVSIGKVAQACATLYRAELKPKPGLISQTFTAATSAMYGALAIIRTIQTDGYLGSGGKIMTMHRAVVDKLTTVSDRDPELCQGPYGIGAMMAFTPYYGDKDKVLNFVKTLFENGVIMFVAGSDPMRVRFLLPMGGITTDDIDRAFPIIEETLVQCR